VSSISFAGAGAAGDGEGRCCWGREGWRVGWVCLRSDTYIHIYMHTYSINGMVKRRFVLPLMDAASGIKEARAEEA
jgi:hypothetical protein